MINITNSITSYIFKICKINYENLFIYKKEYFEILRFQFCLKSIKIKSVLKVLININKFNTLILLTKKNANKIHILNIYFTHID